MSLLNELRRRNVLRVGAAYVVAAWLVIQVAETIFPLFGFDDTPARIVVIVLAIAFVPALVLAWVFEWTPEGLRRDGALGSNTQPVTQEASKTLDRMIMVMLALGLGYFAFDKFVLAPQRAEVQVEVARQEGRAEAIIDEFGDKSIAVLPFSDMSPEKDQEYLSDGIAEELLNQLAMVPELRVISRTSAFAFKGQALEVAEIAKRLKTGYVLEGSVRKAGNTVRITAQLIEARSDTHRWSQSWDRELDDIFAIQDEISSQVVQALKLRLLPSSSAPTSVTPAAYELYLKGQHLLAQRDPAARAFFEQAIELAPDYAPAHASLAKILVLTVDPDKPEAPEQLKRAESAVQRALELDPKDSDAWATRGFMLSNTDLEQARTLFERAIEYNPNNLDAYRWLGFSYRNVDSVRYLEYMQKGYRIAPTVSSISINLFQALARFGRFEEALEVAHDLHYLYPSDPRPFALAGDYFLRTGQPDQALRSYFRAYLTAPDAVSPEIANISWLLLDLFPDSPELALRWTETRLVNRPQDPTAIAQKVILFYQLGRHPEARQLIEETAQRHPGWWFLYSRLYLSVGPDFELSRIWWDRGRDSGSEVKRWDAYRIVDYALALQKTGESEQAEHLIETTLERMEQQMRAGVRSEGEWDLKFYAAILLALRGDLQRTIAYLQQDAESGGLSCITCLRVWPHFIGMRDNPAFQAMIEEQEQILARRRHQLEDAGLLLTPEQVLGWTDYSFDPFQAND